MKKTILCLLFAATASTAYAGGPAVWSVNSRADVLKGEARGVSIDDAGVISLAPSLTEAFRTGQPYVWSSVVDQAGNIYLGTGSDGKIFSVDASGKGSMLADLTELNVSALVLGRNGEIFAASSPDGKVYRIDAAGKTEVYFDPKQKYIWSLAMMPDGALAVGTGENGRVYLVRSANSSPESSLVFDSSETHIISLAVNKAGDLFAGTDPGGIVLRFSGGSSSPFALLDSPLREIHDLAVGVDGSIYALALGESASTAKPADPPSPSTESKPIAAPAATPDASGKSRYDLSTARSAVYRILPDGGSDLIWSSTSVTGFSIYAHQTGNGILIGTSDKGRIFNVNNDGRETLALQTDANQISTISSAGNALLATSSNQGILYRIGATNRAEGTYESTVLDARSTAAWGRIWWRSSGGVVIQTRSGNTDKPDETWSRWASPSPGADSQVASPRSRFLQWRAVLDGSRPGAQLREVSVAYLPRNIAPEVLSVQVFPTNVGLVPNPPVQIDPNIELSGMDPATFGIPIVSVPPRRVYQRAATSLQWTAEDRNGDKLAYDVLYKQVDDADFRPLRRNISETFFTLDGQSLADGRYLFKVVARDTPSNPAGTDLSGERNTLPVDIDNTAPTVTAAGQPQSSGGNVRAVFAASEKASYITRAEFSVNGGEWQVIYTDDGIADSQNERFTINLPSVSAGEYVVTLRVFDVNGNSGSARAIIRR